MCDYVNSSAIFSFHGHTSHFRMVITTLEQSSKVRWLCVGGSSPAWTGTTQEFRLQPKGERGTILFFVHGGWKPDSEACYFCNTTWGHLLVLLKTYLETGERNPYFT
jgi:hypothetical protein